MKHTLKKLLAFSLVLALVAGMLVGCGGAPSSSAANSTSASVEATSSAGGKGENPNAAVYGVLRSGWNERLSVNGAAMEYGGSDQYGVLELREKQQPAADAQA